MVQITHTRIRDDDTGQMIRVSARDFDKKTDGQKTCHCPDENCHATLTHYTEYLQTYYDPQTNEPYRVKVPEHFKRSIGSPPHDMTCKAVDQYTVFQSYARTLDGTALQNGAFVYNLNILTDHYPAPVRKQRALAEEFTGVIQVRDNKSSAPVVNPEQGHRPHQKLSEGLNHVQALAGLLDKTQFDRAYRDSILLRNGKKSYRLSELFEDNAVDLFRAQHVRAKHGEPAQPVLLQFKPIVLAKFHSKKDMIIHGQALPVRGADGKDYSVAVKLHCATKELYDSIKKSLRSGERSFLIYAENAYVDLIEFAHKKHEIQMGTAKDKTVYVHVKATMPQQIMPWKPFNGQLQLQAAGLELPVLHKPVREIPPSLTK